MEKIEFNLATQQEPINVGLDPFAYRGEDGKSPYVDEQGYWWQYNDESGEWENTGILSDRDAAEKALASADAANEAKGNVDKAIQDSQEATKQVNAAVQGAGEATQAAKTAATEAEKQGEAAKAAAQEATEATQKAEESATKADESAQRADEAAERANQAAAANGLRKEIVDALPDVSDMVEDVIYSVPAAHPTQDDARDEYWLVNGQIERFGGASNSPQLPDNLITGEAEGNIQTLYNQTTSKPISPRTVVEALSGTGAEGQLVGFTSENTVGLITPDETPTQGSTKPVQSGGMYDEIGKLATKGYVGEQIDTIEIGGTNLIKNSDFSKGIDGFSFVRGSIRTETIDGFNVLKFTSNSENGLHYAEYRFDIDDLINAVDTNFSLSVYIKTDEEIGVVIQIHNVSKPEEIPAFSESFASKQETFNGWHKLTVSGSREKLSSHQIRAIFGFSSSQSFNKTLYVYHPKLEVGNKATDWSPSPYDMQPAIFDSSGNVQLSKENLQKLADALREYLQ